MNTNYDGTSAGQKNAQYAALHELYGLWDTAATSHPTSHPGRSHWLKLVVVAGTFSTILLVVITIFWPLL